MSNAPPWIPPEQFRIALQVLPLVSIDLCITDRDGRLLLGLRRNRPASGYWFTPGGRIAKGEAFDAAMARIALGEAGLAAPAMEHAVPLGVFDHFYDDSAVGTDVSTHYVNHPYWISLDAAAVATLTLHADEQHAAWCWKSCAEAGADPAVHPYAQRYAQILHLRTRQSGLSGTRQGRRSRAHARDSGPA